MTSSPAPRDMPEFEPPAQTPAPLRSRGSPVRMGSGNAGGGGGGVDGRPRFSWPFFLAALGVGAVLVGMVLALSQPPGTGGKPESSTASGCSATPDVVAPSGGSAQWQQEWSFEAGEGKWGGEPGQDRANFWNAYAHGDCLIVISGWKPGEKTRLTGYRIAEDGPKRLWSIEEEQIFAPDANVWWGGKLVSGQRHRVVVEEGDADAFRTKGGQGTHTSPCEVTGTSRGRRRPRRLEGNDNITIQSI